MSTRHVIVGAGPAGLNAMETILALDPQAHIDLVGDEPPYARMVLPYYLEGKIAEAAVMTGDAAFFDGAAVTTHFGARVASLDTAAKRVALEGGAAPAVLDYDRLLLATGSHAARPPIDGLDGAGVVNLWTLEDAKRFLAGPLGHTLIVGAGFIAFTVLDALAARSQRVSFVELEAQVLPHMLDAPSAAVMRAHLEARGIEVQTGARVERIEQAGSRRRLLLANGDGIDCDAVVVAAGVQPNVAFLEGSGIALGDGSGAGILVDERLQTNADGVYAAGDVAQAADLQTGRKRVHAVQPTAVDHGRVAGANMAGMEVRYEGSLVMNILAAQGLEATSFGRWDGGGDVTTVANPANGIHRKYVWDGDVLAGGILVGPTAAVAGANDVGMLKGLIQTGVSLGPWKAYLQDNPLDLRRVFVASGAAGKLLESTLLTGRASTGGGFRFPARPPRRARTAHHASLFTGTRP